MLVIVVGGVLLIGTLIALVEAGTGPHGFEAKVIGCEFDNKTSAGTTIVNVDYTVKNNNRDSRRATLRIEFRDAGGNVVDDDYSQTRLIGAGDSVHGTEMTFLDVTTQSGTCEITRIS
jgi:hypothetical protein